MENWNTENNSKGFDIQKNNAGEVEADHNAQDNRHCEIGSENNKEELQEKIPSDEAKEKNNDKEGQNTLSKEEESREELHTDAVDTAEYVWNSGNSSSASGTYHFKPENMREYVGTGRGRYTEEHTADDKPVKNKKGKKLKFVALVAVVAILMLSIGGVIGFAVSSRFSGGLGDDNSRESDISLTKNDGSIDVQIGIGSTGYTNLSRSEVVELVADAVVEVTTSTVQTDSFFGGSYVTSGAGSGVVIAQNNTYAYIVTNYHVISGASSISVTLTDKTVVEAEYLDGDVGNDIAVLRIKTDKTFPKIVCGSSKSLKVGEDVVAIGNPLGSLGGTVTEGIISALDRLITVDGITMSLIQTSAAVNPGNSGGGLFNMAGELIGIVNAKQAAEGIEGLGFAIPIDNVYDMIVEVIETNYIHGRPSLGISTEYVGDFWEARSKYSVSATGVFITNSSNNALMVKDLLYSIDGQLITDDSSYVAAIASLEIGEKVKVQLYRKGKAVEVEVEVIEYVPTRIFG